jgi:hypothetical protein
MKWLVLSGTKVTGDGVKALKEKLPDLNVEQ